MHILNFIFWFLEHIPIRFYTFREIFYTINNFLDVSSTCGSIQFNNTTGIAEFKLILIL